MAAAADGVGGGDGGGGSGVGVVGVVGVLVVVAGPALVRGHRMGMVGVVHRSPNDTMIVMQGFYRNYSPRLRWMPVVDRSPVGTRCLVPIWPFVVVAGAMSVRATRRAKRLRQRLAAGLCVHCGYELAGVPVSGDGGRGGVVCPECGSAAAVKREARA